jgi:hypothetical protein
MNVHYPKLIKDLPFSFISGKAAVVNKREVRFEVFTAGGDYEECRLLGCYAV